jgi:cytochrome c peroxidase
MKKYLGFGALALAVVLTLAACGGGDGDDSDAPAAPPVTPPVVTPPAGSSTINPPTKLSLAAQVGQKLFFDHALSGSGKMSCATCHDPNFAYGPPNDLAVQLGGVNMTTPGVRAVPSLRYKDNTPPYADLLDNPDGISVPGPGGGFTWDGRAPTLAEQAKIPLLDPIEMANASPQAVVDKVKAASYAPLFVQAYGATAFDDPVAAFNNVTASLQAFQLEDVSFHPYSSKFDLWAGNKLGGQLTLAELRGLAVFTDANRGNCASCHYQGAGFNGSSALFTDFSYEAISVPRNADIAVNADPTYFDMGICGPLRTDHLPASTNAPNSFCGMYKAPTVRNTATRKTFFHNGVIHSLDQLVHFYNTRDTRPELWYPTTGGTPKATPDADFPTYGLITTQYTGGTVQKYNDLPAAYRTNIDPQMPLDGRAAGSAPPMTDQEMSDLVCFLGALTDGYQPPASAPTTGPCIN